MLNAGKEESGSTGGEKEACHINNGWNKQRGGYDIGRFSKYMNDGIYRPTHEPRVIAD